MRSETRRNAVSLLSLFAVVIGTPSAVVFVVAYFLGFTYVFYSAVVLLVVAIGARLGAVRLARNYTCPGCGERVYGFHSMIGPTQFPTACVKCGASLTQMRKASDGGTRARNSECSTSSPGATVKVAQARPSVPDIPSPYGVSVQEEQTRRVRRSSAPTLAFPLVVVVLLIFQSTGTSWIYVGPALLIVAALFFANIKWQMSVRCPRCGLSVSRAGIENERPGKMPIARSKSPDSCPRCGNAWDLEPAAKTSLDK